MKKTPVSIEIKRGRNSVGMLVTCSDKELVDKFQRAFEALLDQMKAFEKAETA